VQQRLIQCLDEFLVLDWLADVDRRTQRQRQLLFAHHRAGDYGNIPGQSILVEQSQELPSVYIRQHDVQYDDVRLRRSHSIQDVRALSRMGDMVASTANTAAIVVDQIPVVIHDQHPDLAG